MANPQVDDGQWTRIANEIMEAIPRARLTAAQYDVVLVLIRRTYGYNRTTCRLSIASIQRASGRDYKLLRSALLQLEQRNIVSIKRSGQRMHMALIKDFDQWLPAKSSNYSDDGNRANHPNKQGKTPQGKTPYQIGQNTLSNRAKHPTIKDNCKRQLLKTRQQQSDSTQDKPDHSPPRDDGQARVCSDEQQTPNRPPPNPTQTNNPAPTAQEGTMPIKDFDALWQANPKRHGSHNRTAAQRAYEFAIMRGHQHRDMLNGWKAYARWAVADGCEGTRYCKSLAKFIEQEQWLEDWSIRPGSGDRHQRKRLDPEQANHAGGWKKPDGWTEDEYRRWGTTGSTAELNARTAATFRRITAAYDAEVAADKAAASKVTAGTPS